jgi:hypothetical protein
MAPLARKLKHPGRPEIGSTDRHSIPDHLARNQDVVAETEKEMNAPRPLPWIVKFFAAIALTWMACAALYLIVFLCYGAALSEHLPLPRWGHQGQ